MIRYPNKTLGAVHEVISGIFMTIMPSHMEFQIKTFTGGCQHNEHCCGVLVVQ
eukprot:jgi/Phyca11/132365/e_gw1.156.10.1